MSSCRQCLPRSPPAADTILDSVGGPAFFNPLGVRSLSALMGGVWRWHFKGPQREPFIFHSKVTELKTFINNVKGSLSVRNLLGKNAKKSEGTLLYQSAPEIKARLGSEGRREACPFGAEVSLFSPPVCDLEKERHQVGPEQPCRVYKHTCGYRLMGPELRRSL